MKEDNYEDIINLEHHISLVHPQMSITARSAQFAPFAALTGYDDAVKETARLTDKKIEIDEELKLDISNKLQLLLENIKANYKVTFTYFIQDGKKKGGKYVETSGIIKKIDMDNRYVILDNKKKISIDDIIAMESDLFNY